MISGRGKLLRFTFRSLTLLSLVSVILVLYDIGFNKPVQVSRILIYVYLVTVSGGSLFMFLSYVSPLSRPKKKVWGFDMLIITFFVLVLLNAAGLLAYSFFLERITLQLSVFLVFIREYSSVRFRLRQNFINPARLFVLSFIGIILLGTVLLMLPRSTYSGISLIDALFTSTSAVCVTGLIVVDTGTYFTTAGQSIIMFLMQAGGIGIMTFTSYFGYFFKGGSSYQNRLMMQDVYNSDKIAEVFVTLKQIILITFVIEIIGSVIIYFSLNDQSGSQESRIFFSIFHAVSGFCNAGFSTLSDSLYTEGYRFNYLLHLTIASLFIIGGLGFPILFNAISYFKHLFIYRIFGRREYRPWLLGINARIVVITTVSLLVAGTILFLISENDNTLASHNGAGKVITAFFSAATPRTAGFNTVDTSALHFSTVMIVLVLMWIGASPGSTGGGIKTSTFAISLLNFLSLAKGKDRVEVYRREISPMSIRRAFAILALSILVIGLSILFLSLSDGDKGLLAIAFESFSAFSTVGLSLGITDQLSVPGRIIIVLTMFIGRVSMLTILAALMRKIVNLKYKYPTEDILIN